MQAIILAGGKATRMRPYTDERPKAMVEVGGEPILEHQLRWLESNGIADVVVSCGYMSDVIRDHVDSRSGHAKIALAVESEPLGRGGGIKFAAGHLSDKGARFVAVNGDVLTDLKVADLLEQHRRIDVVASIALAQYQTSWGVADLEGDLIRGFIQSPKLPYWINAGVYCFEPSVVPLLPDVGDHEDSTFPDLAAQGNLGAFKIKGYWRGIDTVKDINIATEELNYR